MPRSALPAVRLLRGDAGFGYELPGTGPGKGRSVKAVAQELVSGVMDEVWHGGEKAVTRLTAEQAEEWRAANDTRVLATLHRPESMRAFVQARRGQACAAAACSRTADRHG